MVNSFATQGSILNGSKPRIAVCTLGVKLPGETRGYTRFRKIAEMLVQTGFDVDLITSSFQHWEKAQRDVSATCYRNLPYNIVFIHEPGYVKNVDVRRIWSHKQAAQNMRDYFSANTGRYALIYSEIPPNDCALACAEAAKGARIPFIADVNDLWPEAMRMALDLPIVSDIAFAPFSRDAAQVYRMLDAAVGTSDEYAARPAADRTEPYKHITVYVGNDLAEFDAGVNDYAGEVYKPEGEFWVTYAGTLGESYDLQTLIAAAAACADALPRLRVKILGDGPDRSRLEGLTRQLGAPVDFLGYLDYGHMAAWLAKSDATINSLRAKAPQSIVTKIGDYLAAGIPLVNTGSSNEFRNKVASDGFGVNVPAGDVEALACALYELATNDSARREMGKKARIVAEEQFDQKKSYLKIVDLVRTLLA